MLFGNLFSWSLTNIKKNNGTDSLGFPFNEYFSFFVMSILGFISAAVAYLFLPLAYNHKPEPLVRGMVEELENEDESRKSIISKDV